MLLTITYTGNNTTDLGYLLYKNPSRPQVTELNYGRAYVFYPEAGDGRTTVALLLDVDPIDLARGKAGAKSGGLFDYVNDRPYVSSSFMSTAISKVFGTAMTGRADAHQELSDSPLDLEATVTMLPCRGDQEKLNSVFEPLGYEVSYESFVADELFPDWGESAYVNLTIKGKVRLRDLLKHLYVLIPVFDRQKHYWVGEDEIEKLLRLGEDWLPAHPEKGYITARYLTRRRSLINMAFEKLAGADAAAEAEDDTSGEGSEAGAEDVEAAEVETEAAAGEAAVIETAAGAVETEAAEVMIVAAGGDKDGAGGSSAEAPDVGVDAEDKTKEVAGSAEDNAMELSGASAETPDADAGPVEEGAEEAAEPPVESAGKKPKLNTQRLDAVIEALKEIGARRVIDIGCGEGRLMALLVKERQFTQIAGADVSNAALKRAAEKLNLERGSDSLRERIKVFQGSLTYRDARFSGYDAACVIEVVEHLDKPRLAAFERVLFEFAKPPTVILTTPNKEYNAIYGMPEEKGLRHGDHRFEWTREEFRSWAEKTADKFGYEVNFSEIGEIDEACGAPTQMGVFTLCG